MVLILALYFALRRMDCFRALFREEQEEILRSKKRVKDVSHVGFQEGLDSAASSPEMMESFGAGPHHSKTNWFVKSLVLSHKLSASETSWRMMLNLMKRLKPLGKDW